MFLYFSFLVLLWKTTENHLILIVNWGFGFVVVFIKSDSWLLHFFRGGGEGEGVVSDICFFIAIPNLKKKVI